MMSEADKVLIILERDYSFAVYFGQRENIFQYVRDTISQSRVEVVEYEVRIGLAHWVHLILQVMSENHIR